MNSNLHHSSGSSLPRGDACLFVFLAAQTSQMHQLRQTKLSLRSEWWVGDAYAHYSAVSGFMLTFSCWRLWTNNQQKVPGDAGSDNCRYCRGWLLFPDRSRYVNFRPSRLVACLRFPHLPIYPPGTVMVAVAMGTATAARSAPLLS